MFMQDEDEGNNVTTLQSHISKILVIFSCMVRSPLQNSLQHNSAGVFDNLDLIFIVQANDFIAHSTNWVLGTGQHATKMSGHSTLETKW